MKQSFLATVTNVLVFTASAIVAVVFIMPLVMVATIFVIPKHEN
jgi:hypothetical protein